MNHWLHTEHESSDSGEENLPLTGRNLQPNQNQNQQSSDDQLEETDEQISKLMKSKKLKSGGCLVIGS